MLAASTYKASGKSLESRQEAGRSGSPARAGLRHGEPSQEAQTQSYHEGQQPRATALRDAEIKK